MATLDIYQNFELIILYILFQIIQYILFKQHKKTFKCVLTFTLFLCQEYYYHFSNLGGLLYLEKSFSNQQKNNLVMKDCMMHKKISQLDKNKYLVEKMWFYTI